MSYDRDLRLRALEYAKEGHSLTQTAAVFKINISTIIAWKRRYEATGDVKVKIRRPVNKKIIPEELIKYIEETFWCLPQRNRGSLRLSSLFRAETAAKAWYYAKKKSTFYKEHAPQTSRGIFRTRNSVFESLLAITHLLN